jgi:hypothetical protein
MVCRPPRLPSELPRLQCVRSRLHFEPLEILNLDFNADSDPAFHSNVDQDPALKKKNRIRIHIRLVIRTYKYFLYI